jgi:hypothetical protein
MTRGVESSWADMADACIMAPCSFSACSGVRHSKEGEPATTISSCMSRDWDFWYLFIHRQIGAFTILAEGVACCVGGGVSGQKIPTDEGLWSVFEENQNGNIEYIDTELKFCSSRLLEILVSKYPQLQSVGCDFTALLERVKVYRPMN